MVFVFAAQSKRCALPPIIDGEPDAIPLGIFRPSDYGFLEEFMAALT